MLFSECKCAGTDYVIVLDKTGINIYDGTTANIIIVEKKQFLAAIKASTYCGVYNSRQT